MINLKDLRDKLIGYKASPPVVISWGIVNGGRLGIPNYLDLINKQSSDQNNSDYGITQDDEDEDEEHLVASPPQIIEFKQDVDMFDENQNSQYVEIT